MNPFIIAAVIDVVNSIGQSSAPTPSEQRNQIFNNTQQLVSDATMANKLNNLNANQLAEGLKANSWGNKTFSVSNPQIKETYVPGDTNAYGTFKDVVGGVPIIGKFFTGITDYFANMKNGFGSIPDGFDKLPQTVHNVVDDTIKVHTNAQDYSHAVRSKNE